MERASNFFASSLRFRASSRETTGYTPRARVFLLAREPISEPPQFAALGLNEDVKSAAIRKLSGPGRRLGFPHSDVFEHVGIAP